MTDYKSLKVPELKELLQKRALQVSGNKAELIARLEEADKSAGGASAPAPAKPAATKTKRSASPTKAAAKPVAARPSQPPAAPRDPPPTQSNTRTQDASLSKDKPAATTETTAVVEEQKVNVESEAPVDPPKSFAANLPASEVDAELEKRKKRAARFGVAPEQASDAQKALERAKKFGTEATEDGGQAAVIKGLDSSLPERMRKERAPRGQKRESEDEGGRDSSKRAKGNKPNAARPQAKAAANSSAPRYMAKTAASSARSGGGILGDPKEKAKAEERAKRFATKA